MGRSAAALVALLASSASAETLTYSYDVHGRLINTARSGGPGSGTTTRYSYDRADNLNQAWVGAGTPPGGPAGRPPAFTISNASMPEGHILTFTVFRHGSINGSFTVNYSTASGTATSGVDFAPTSGTLTFGPDDFRRTVSVQSTHEYAYEPDETFVLNLSSPSGGATLSDAQGTGTIVNDDSSNLPPVGVTDYNTAASCLPSGKVMVVTTNDTDPEGNYPITLVGIDSVTGGASATVENSTSVRFFPGAPTTSYVTYRIQDSLGAQGTGQLRVTVYGAACP